MNWTYRMWDRIRRFYGRPRIQKLLLIEAYGYLFLARFAILTLPFKVLARWCAGEGASHKDLSPGVESELVTWIQWSIVTATRYSSWKSLCFTQALAAKSMLRRRGIKSALYLGVANAGQPDIRAHAWLKVGQRIVTGEAGYRQYAPVACFVEKEPRASEQL